jgi:hypothetical protein
MSALDLGMGMELGLDNRFGVAEADESFQQVDLNNNQDIALKGNFERNCLNDLFFSKTNMDALQTGIRNMVANATNGESIIGDQSETELLIIMRGTYNQYGLNQPDNVVQQVRDLNKMVLDYCVKQIIREIEQYKIYLRDASQMYVPIDMPVNVNNKGSKVLHRETLW